MNITVLIKDGNTARLNDGIRLALGLTIGHKVSLLITEKGADSLMGVLTDSAFKKQFLESIGLIIAMSGVVKTEKAMGDAGPIETISKDALTKILLDSDSIILF